jgi:hypothetical protein
MMTIAIASTTFAQDPGIPARLGMLDAASTPLDNPVADSARVEIRNTQTDSIVTVTSIGTLLEDSGTGRFAASIPVEMLSADSYYVRIYNTSETNAAFFVGDSAPFTLEAGTVTLISGFETATALLTEDSDGDGLSLSYEMLLNTSDLKTDSDGDGMTDNCEFKAGTDATDSASSMKITAMEQQGETMTLRLQTVSGKRYQLIYYETLAAEGQTMTDTIQAESNLLELQVSLPEQSTGFFQFVLMEEE